MLLCETICGIPSHDGMQLIYQTGMLAADMFSLEKYLPLCQNITRHDEVK